MAMAKKTQASGHQDRARALIAEVEGLARRLRGDLKRRIEASVVVRQIERAATQLRTRAAAAAGQVERYAHRLRVELEKGSGASARTKRAPKRRRTASRRRVAAPAPPSPPVTS